MGEIRAILSVVNCGLKQTRVTAAVIVVREHTPRPCQLGVCKLRGGIRGPPEDADDGVDAEREEVPESRRHPIRLPLFVERVRNLEPHLVPNPRHRDHHRDGQRAESVVQSRSFVRST